MATPPPSSTPVTIDLSAGWYFLRSKMASQWLAGAPVPAGEPVDLPHCWNTDDTFQDGVLPYAGFGCYRKRFETKPVAAGSGVWLLSSEGFYGLAEIWLNGRRCARVDGQYLGFELDCTRWLRPGTSNLLAIRLTNDCPRHVLPGHRNPDFLLYGGLTGRIRLVHRPLLRLDRQSVTIRTQDLRADRAELLISGQVASSATSQGTTSLAWQILDPDGRQVASTPPQQLTVPAGRTSAVLSTPVTVSDARLWSIEQPQLYTAQALIGGPDAGESTEIVSHRFGLRTAEFTSEGFFLNGQRLRLQGCNRHESLPGFGQALPKKLQRRDAELLKELGLNFVRLSHYPQHRWFLDACDELGILVYAEIATWKSVRSGRWLMAAVRQMEGLLRRDRNHPSIIIWGMGNESRSRRAYQQLRRVARELDPTRPVTYAENHLGRARLNKVAGIPDVWGINYELSVVEQACASSRLGCALVAECLPYRAGERGSGRELDQVTTLLDDLQQIDQHEHLAGYAIWAFTDYATMHLNRYRRFSGLLDAWRLPKISGLVMKARLASEPFVRLYGPWGESGPTGTATGATRQLQIISNCDQVSLYHDGSVVTTVGAGLLHSCELPYLGGELVAVGERSDGRAEHCLVAFGPPERLSLELEQPVTEPAEPPLFLAVRVVDAAGRQVSSWNGQVQLSAAGPGRINSFTPAGVVTIARGEGRSFLTPTAATGAVVITARGPELAPATVVYRADQGPVRHTTQQSAPAAEGRPDRTRTKKKRGAAPLKKAVLVTRTLLGLLLVLRSLDSLLHLLPQRQPSPAASQLLAALAASGYLLPMITGLELLAGLVLIAGYFAPLALAVLAPILLNLVVFHLFLDLGGLPVAMVLLLLEAFLVWAYRDYFEELLQAKPQVW